MQSKPCCEEMNEFVRSVENFKDQFRETKLFFDNNQTPEELAIGISLKDSYIPNIIFRFCPFCGTLLQKGNVPQQDDSVVGKLSTIAFDRDLDDEGIASACKAALMQDAINQMRAILKTASISSKPVTGFIKTS